MALRKLRSKGETYRHSYKQDPARQTDTDPIIFKLLTFLFVFAGDISKLVYSQVLAQVGLQADGVSVSVRLQHPHLKEIESNRRLISLCLST